MLGSLRAACDEMGAVLVRSAHSANIKERRDASTALFDADGQMVMQAEHIPVHLGAMPSRRGGGARRGAAARRVLDPQRPLPRRHPPAGHHGDHAALPRRRARPASPRAARTTPTWAREEPGSMPALSRTLDDEGVVIPPTRLTDEVLHELAGRMRNPRQREADLRAQLAAGRAGGERVAALIERFGIDTVRAGMRETLDYAERRTRARHRGAATTACARRATCSRPPTGDLELRVTARVEGDGDRARLLRLRPAARRQPQLPARRDAVRLLLRAARAHRPGRAALRGRLPAADRDRARGLAAERAPARRGGRRQRGDLLARGRPRARAPSATRSARAR